MNQYIFLIAGIIAGITLTVAYYKPDELKSDLSGKEATLTQCQNQLVQKESQINGMLMNK
jgi:hypothetical protein